jgi:hypothetical protein
LIATSLFDGSMLALAMYVKHNRPSLVIGPKPSYHVPKSALRQEKGYGLWRVACIQSFWMPPTSNDQSGASCVCHGSACEVGNWWSTVVARVACPQAVERLVSALEFFLCSPYNREGRPERHGVSGAWGWAGGVVRTQFPAKGVRKVTTGITGLWRPSVDSDVAF